MPREVLSQDHIAQLKALLERAKAAHLFTPDEGKAVLAMVATFEKHKTEFSAIIAREQAKQAWATVRYQLWSIIRWLLVTLGLIVSALVGWTQLIKADRWWPL